MIDILRQKAEETDPKTETFYNRLHEHNFVWVRNKLGVVFSMHHIVQLQFKKDVGVSPVFIPSYKMKFDISDKLNEQLQG